MKFSPPFRTTYLVLACSCLLQGPAFQADSVQLSSVKSQADLEALTSATSDKVLKQGLRDHAAAILAAAAERPHIEAVIRTIEAAPGKVQKINTTPESLKKATGGDVALFDTLKLVDLAMPNAGPHDHRKSDPFDAAFFEHLGHISALESLNIIATKASDDWIIPLGRLTGLKSLKFTNNGNLTDTGLQKLAGLRQMESFSFVGTGMQGHAFAAFDGWTRLKSSSFRGSKLDDEGLRLLCERFSSLESLSLAHAKFTNTGAPHLAKLTRLKSLELGTPNATPESLLHIASLPLENLQLGEGFESPACIPLIQGISTLRRLTLTNAKDLTNDDLKTVAGLKQLESLELNNLPLPDERLAQLTAFSFLKSFRLVRRPQAYPAGTQAQIKALLPAVALKFD